MCPITRDPGGWNTVGLEHRVVDVDLPLPRPHLVRHEEMKYDARAGGSIESIEPRIPQMRGQFGKAPLGEVLQLHGDTQPVQLANELPNVVVVSTRAFVGAANLECRDGHRALHSRERPDRGATSAYW